MSHNDGRFVSIGEDCAHCLSVEGKLMPVFNKKEYEGLTLSLIKVVEERICTECKEVTRHIPNIHGLVSAVAITRALNPIKFNGQDIKYVRKAIGMSSKDMATALEVTGETMSRWENNRLPMTPLVEKWLRLLVCKNLKDAAPLITFTDKEIMDMKIKSIRSDQDNELHFAFCLTKVPTAKPEAPLDDAYYLPKKVA